MVKGLRGSRQRMDLRLRDRCIVECEGLQARVWLVLAEEFAEVDQRIGGTICHERGVATDGEDDLLESAR